MMEGEASTGARPLRIGFATIYSWRPHVEHSRFLALLAERAGHTAHFLTCDSDLPTCYTRELRAHSAWRECFQCRAGGIRSYTTDRVASISSCAPRDDGVAPIVWAQSSASTLGRYETDDDYAAPEFRMSAERLLPATQLGFRAARAWIRDEQLDAVCVFNGRMDVTRGIFEAAKSLGVRVVSLERTWFSHGLQLYPEESCMGLKSVHKLIGQWREKPLTRRQSVLAASYVARRFLRRNSTEWRAYNVNAKATGWPVQGGRQRILLLPSSRNEVWGQPDWESGWLNPLDAYDALIEHLGLTSDDLLLRCHPNWAENIGRTDGERSERYYTDWAARRGIHVIASQDATSTLGLIEECDAIVVANGSAALEAGILGKQVIGTAPSIYQEAGLRDSVTGPQEMETLRLHSDLSSTDLAQRRETVSRQTLRFAYNMVHRVPQYTRSVYAQSPTQFVYDLTADPHRFIELLRTGELQADDEEFAATTTDENDVLNLIVNRDWQGLLGALDPEVRLNQRVRRRFLFRPIDAIRHHMAIGDR